MNLFYESPLMGQGKGPGLTMQAWGVWILRTYTETEQVWQATYNPSTQEADTVFPEAKWLGQPTRNWQVADSE